MFMDAPAPIPSDDATDDAQFHRSLVRRLLVLGADMAEQIHQHATTQMAASPDAATVTAFGNAFAQASLCVRKGVLLARHVAEPARPAIDRVAARQRIIRTVEDTIQRTDTTEHPDTLHAELRERLDSPDLDDDLAGRPVDEIIAEIVRDLGLAAATGSHPWKRRTPDDVAALRAWAATPPPISRRHPPATAAAGPAATPRRWPPVRQTRPP
jgi:hypothetical protein